MSSISRQTNKKEKKTRIVEAAARVFGRRGFSGTVMADIAAEVGIGKGTLYEYFDSKEDIFFAVFEWFSQKTAGAAKVRISVLGGSTSERLEALVESVLDLGTEMKDLFSLSMEFWAASASSQIRSRFVKAFREAYENFRHIISDLILDGIERGEFRPDVDPASIAAGLVGGLDGLFLQAWFDESIDPRTTGKKFVAGLINGLATKHEAGRSP